MIALASVKASPGVTTTALALAGAWQSAQRRLLIEADPCGGDLGPRLGLPAAAGLAGLAAAARHGHDRDLPWQHARELAAGMFVITAPAGAGQAAACVAALAATTVAQDLAAGPEVALADCGRLYPGSPALPVAAAALVTLLVIRPRVSELAQLEPRIHELAQAGLRLALILAPAAGRPAEPCYPAAEIAAALGVPVRASLPADPRAAQQLVRTPGDPGRARRLPLLRKAASLAVALDQIPKQADPPALPAGLRARQDTEVTIGERR